MTSSDDLPCYVLDASVATKWYLQDEHDMDAADTLLARYRDGRVQILAPDHIRYEVAAAIRNGLRMHRLTIAQARTAISEFLAWKIPTVNDDALIIEAYDRSTEFGCSLYDGLYLALAEQAGYPLIHADGRIRRTLAGRFPQEIWLADYVEQSTGK